MCSETLCFARLNMPRITSLFLLLLLLHSPLLAQSRFQADLLDGLQGAGGAASNPNLNLSATYQADASGKFGQLKVTAKVGASWYLYSTTQPKGGPLPTTLQLESPQGAKLLNDFQADHAPKVVPADKIIRVQQEKFYDQVSWTALFSIPSGAKPESLGLTVKLNGQCCHDRGTCVPVKTSTTANFDGVSSIPLGDVQLPASASTPVQYQLKGTPGPFTSSTGHATISGTIQPAVVAPGDRVTVTLTASPGRGYHVYKFEPTDSTLGYKSTQIALAEQTPWLATLPSTNAPVVEKELVPNFPPVKYHKGSPSWNFSVQVPIDASPGKHPLVGLMGFQTCTDSTCDRPEGVQFEGIIEVAESTKPESTELAFSPASYVQAATRAKFVNSEVQGDGPPNPQAAANAPPLALDVPDSNIGWQVIQSTNSKGEDIETTQSNLGWVMLFSFIGGFILNFMPCVLPVVGLKILSFVNQAGRNRAAVFLLNLVYSLGVISVFMVLATLSSSQSFIWGLFFSSAEVQTDSTGMAWGEWSGNWVYILGMIVLVYTMGLSMLGVWELTMPSFVGSKGASLSSHEGMGGAFFKGVVTTLLSTPCSGPFLGPVFGYTISQPVYITFVVFGFIGLGMASPYLLIGMFPKLIAFLPKPGNWMIVFKQAMGFVMMLTVVYLVYTLEDKLVVPTLTLLVAMGASCWLFGQRHLLRSSWAKDAAVAGGLALSIGMGVFAFTYLVEGEDRWQTYRENEWPQLENEILALQNQGQTVMVDFTADWCPTCQLNYYNAIDTPNVREFLDQEGIKPAVVDWTNTSHENDEYVRRFINKLGADSIPVLAIFPGKSPGDVIVLTDLLTESVVLANLKKASQYNGPTRAATKPAELEIPKF